jgi:hypothetical protein
VPALMAFFISATLGAARTAVFVVRFVTGRRDMLTVVEQAEGAKGSLLYALHKIIHAC